MDKNIEFFEDIVDEKFIPVFKKSIKVIGLFSRYDDIDIEKICNDIDIPIDDYEKLAKLEDITVNNLVSIQETNPDIQRSILILLKTVDKIIEFSKENKVKDSITLGIDYIKNL